MRSSDAKSNGSRGFNPLLVVPTLGRSEGGDERIGRPLMSRFW